jgi:hypothetical protein
MEGVFVLRVEGLDLAWRAVRGTPDGCTNSVMDNHMNIIKDW